MYIWRKFAASDWVRRHHDELVARFGVAVGITERPEKLRTLVQISCATREEAGQLQAEFGGASKELPPNWLQQFTKAASAQPLRIGSRLIVTRTRNFKDEKTIIIPAEAAFGTGEHATTAMCLRLVERATRKWGPGWRMLDAGTGSGILAIAGARFGAGQIIAIDNDPLAVLTARRNAGINRVRNVEFRTGDVIRQKLSGHFDLITANLYSEILMTALPGWRSRLAGDGRLVLSGVLRSQEGVLLAGLRRNGFTTEEIRRRGKWIALLAARGRKNS
jgi:ribosomal protein L11 methyltransferase